MRFICLLFLVFSLFMFVGCDSGATSQSATVATPTPTVPPVPTPPNIPSRLVSFTTSDHVKLDGLLYGQGKTMVICSHMYGTTLAIWRDSGIPERLAALGYQVLIYDFRGYGGSDGDPDSSVLDVDLNAAVSFAQQQGAAKIVLMGASMGGTASLNVASHGQVAAVISLSGPQSFGVSVTDTDLAAMKVPKLFIDSTDDDPYVSDARHMYDIASPPKEISIYPGSAHGTAIFYGESGDEPAQRILHFITQYAPAS